MRTRIAAVAAIALTITACGSTPEPLTPTERAEAAEAWAWEHAIQNDLCRLDDAGITEYLAETFPADVIDVASQAGANRTALLDVWMECSQ